MTRRRAWAVVPAFLAVGALVAGLAAYSGAQGSTNRGAAEKGIDRPHEERLDIRDTVYKGVLLDARAGPWGYHGASSTQGYSPPQPVAFPHPLHVQKLGMNCAYCHFAANKSPDPGMPAVSTCMGCHTVVATGKPEVKRLAAYWNKKQPVPWVRIHKVPEYVHFPHMRHVDAGVTCQTCHGQVQKMNQVYQYSSLNMGWCVDCHVNGYDPQAGDKAAGYQRTANGYRLMQSADAGAASRGLSLVSTANAQATTQPVVNSPTVPGGAATAGGRKHARYDCSVCHY
jgi:hypothetical protein